MAGGLHFNLAILTFGAVQVSAVFRIVENQEELVVGELSSTECLGKLHHSLCLYGSHSSMLNWDCVKCSVSCFCEVSI